MAKFLFPIICLGIFIGCNNIFEMKESGGNLYRLNKITGKIDRIEGQTLIRLKCQLDTLNKNITLTDTQKLISTEDAFPEEFALKNNKSSGLTNMEEIELEILEHRRAIDSLQKRYNVNY